VTARQSSLVRLFHVGLDTYRHAVSISRYLKNTQNRRSTRSVAILRVRATRKPAKDR